MLNCQEKIKKQGLAPQICIVNGGIVQVQIIVYKPGIRYDAMYDLPFYKLGITVSGTNGAVDRDYLVDGPGEAQSPP